MLLDCKVTKLWEINYKILAHILTMPVVVAATRKVAKLQWCVWCGEKASLSHVLLSCTETGTVHQWVHNHTLLKSVSNTSIWIFGQKDKKLNPVIWVTNFAIYKSHLQALDGYVLPISEQLERELLRFQTIYPVLRYH